MKSTEMNRPVTAAQLNENMYKQFNVKINFEKYTREQLENARNLLRTKTGTVESSANFNDLLSNESYQRDKFMLGVLNTKIKEMLGESKLAELSVKKLDKFRKDARAASRDDSTPDDKKIKHITGAQKADKKIMAKTGKYAEDINQSGNKMKNKKTTEAAPATIKTSSGGHATRTATGVVHKAGSKGYGNKWDGETQDQAPAKSKAAKSAAEKKASKANDIKLPAWKGNVTKHSSNHGAEKDDGTGDVSEALKGKQKKLDADKDGKLEKSDFKKLRAKKSVKESEMMHLAYANFINEGLRRFVAEDEEGKAKSITAAADMVNDFTSWMQRVGNYQTKSMIELADNIRANFGMQEAETFKQAVGQALEGALNSLTTAREEINNAVAVLAGEAPAEEQMGQDMSQDVGDVGMADPEMDASMDAMNPSAEDEFAASDAASGGPDTTGRAMREHIEKGNRLMRMLGS
jgi:hypothetical protein